MEQFVVSARKYRPGTFDSVVGQEHITQTLRNAIRNNHLAQAFLFCGPRGVGKTTCARILAKTINCENLKENVEPCNECTSCVSFNHNGSFNIYELDAASNNSVDDIRGLVEQVRYAPQGAKYKIYIIDEVHMLSQAAFNAFLKTLEEPPSYAIFILATTERHKILPTILSRCQIFDFNRITVDSMVKHLAGIAEKEKVEAEPEALHIIAEKADGALRDALSIFDQMVSFSGDKLGYADVIKNLNILDYDYYFRALDHMLEENTSSLLLLLDDVLKKGFDPHLFLGGLCDHIRNLLVCKDSRTLALLEVAETAAARYGEQAARIPLNYLFNALQVASGYDASYKAARNQRLHVELALLKLANLSRALQLAVYDKTNPDQEKKTSLGRDKVENRIENKVEVKNESKPEIPVAGVEDVPAKKLPEAPKTVIPSLNLGFKPDALKTDAEPELPEAVSAPETQGTARVPLVADKVEAIWLEFADSMEKAAKMGLATGMRKAVLTLDDKRLTATVATRLTGDYITEVKTELMAYMNSRLQSDLHSLDVRVEKVEASSSQPYTLEERLKSMVQSNPNLPDFMQKLGLELDYDS